MRSYPPDNFRGLWEKIDDLIDSGELIASEEVLVELERKKDDLYEWARKRRKMFLPIDEDVQEAVQDLLAKYPKLVGALKNRSMADPFVIALAQVHDCMVVSNEDFGSEKKPKIPFVCQRLGLRCMNILGLIQEQGWRFE